MIYSPTALLKERLVAILSFSQGSTEIELGPAVNVVFNKDAVQAFGEASLAATEMSIYV